MRNYHWILKMAWQDAIQNKKRLLIYVSSIVMGISALVAIQSFKEGVSNKINDEAKTLLGADLVVRNNQSYSISQLKLINTIVGEQAKEKSFASMLLVPKNGRTKLINARALEGNYPFYGEIETLPKGAISKLNEGNNVIIDETAMLQLDLKVGDSITLGTGKFKVIAAVIRAPGQNGITATVAPPVYFSLAYLAQTHLEARGSRIVNSIYFKLNNNQFNKKQLNTIRDQLYSDSIRIETVAQRKQRTGEAFNYLATFLNLIGFIALILGGVGVASSVTLYLKEKKATIATLRCIGTDSKSIFLIYFIEIVVVGFLGSVAGAVLGSLFQYYLPTLLEDVLVIDLTLDFNVRTLFLGVFVGTLSAILFTLEPLLSIQNIAPLAAINNNAGQLTNKRVSYYLPKILILLFIFGFSYFQLKDAVMAISFSVALGVIFFSLWFISFILSKVIIRKTSSKLPYTIRQGLLNISRPNNQTTELTISIGLGALMIALLFFLQGNLISQMTLMGNGEQPNMILFDIQKDQTSEMKSFLKERHMDIIQEVPIITTRLKSIKGIPKHILKKDSVLNLPSRILNGEYRVSYRDSITPSETIVAGTYIGNAKGLDYVPVSLEKRLADQMKVTIGDTLVYDIQGVDLEVVVKSIRNVKWNSVQTNFRVLFPKGVLEKAPQFYALVTRTTNKKQSARFQTALIKKFPNISIVDLNSILKTVNAIFTKIRTIIQFMAFLSIITGLLVLMGTIFNSKFQRLEETVLLRTLGATRKQVIRITVTEYITLGSMAALSGIILGSIAALCLSIFVFKIDYSFDFLTAFILWIFVVGAVTFLGFFNNQSIFKKSPIAVLRSQSN